jgi:four helix bundle protein
VILNLKFGESMTFSEWEKGVPDILREDALWTVKAYRLSLFLADIAWNDVLKLSKTNGMRSLSDQLYRSCGSICANLEEGYSKASPKDRARFYEYSLGSSRETRGWFYRGRHILGEKVFDYRAWLLTEIIKMLLAIVPEERGYRIHEDAPEYVAASSLDKEVPF